MAAPSAERPSQPPPCAVAGQLSEGREADDPSVRSDPGAVEAGAAHDRHAPPAVGASSQDGESVVPNDGGCAPAFLVELGGDPPVIHGEVGAGDAVDTDARHR